MQTQLAEFVRNTAEGREAEAILRKCVHCGFCNATCPTYRLLGNELDGPRGRIYLIKQLLEGAEVGAPTQLHLDRCLTCRACETTCPSGVQYSRLADIGRNLVEAQVSRSLLDRLRRYVLARFLPNARAFAALVRLGRVAKPLLPSSLRAAIPEPPRTAGHWPQARHARRMLVLRGCVQSGLAPRTNAAAARVLDRLGISLIEVPGAGCCGALRFHIGWQSEGLNDARAVVDALWPMLADGGAEAIVMTASGCGAMLKEYGHLLAADPVYAEKAARVSAVARDLSEVVAAEADALARVLGSTRADSGSRGRVVFQAPCTLQHAQRLPGIVERILRDAGWECVPAANADQCCGSAGTYSLLQPELSARLRKLKLDALESTQADVIATANIGCQIHLQAGTNRPVRHWVELMDDAIAPL